jgi:hypothetical protein
MSVLALDLALVRDVLLPGLSLTPGRAMMARVVNADEGSGGTLAIAGYLLDAELPRGLASGQTLRLLVRDVSADRVLLSVAPHEASAPSPLLAPSPPLAPPVALPGGGELRVLEDEGEADGSGRGPGGHSLGLALELPGLGSLELRFGLDQSAIRTTILTDPGPPFDRAQSRAGELRAALTRECGRPAAVTISARRPPLDLYA